MKRRAFIRSAGAAVMAPALKSRAQATSPPNVVLILADDLGFGDLSCYGSQILTPNLDRMAREGVRFTQFYAASPVCSPTRASVMTGRYGVRVGVPTVLWPDSADGLAESETTVAQMLKPSGYRTMCIGKWHLGRPAKYMPTARGFDEYFGIPYSNDMEPSVLMHNMDIIESPVDLSTLTRRYTDEAVRFISSGNGKPFFLYLPHTFPHIPLAASAAFQRKSGMGLYGDVVQELDWSVGRILETLQDKGLDHNTLVMFTSDNGPFYQGSPGRLRGRKGDTFEGGVRVPFLARFPGRIPYHGARHGVATLGEGRIVSEMATTLDLLPTIAGLAGAALPRTSLDGVDIGALVTGAKSTTERPAFFYFSGWHLQCVRQGPWKLHVARANAPAYTPEPKIGLFNLPLLSPELYNIDADPEEAEDASAQHPAVVAQLQDAITQAMPSFPGQVQAAWRETQQRRVYPNEPGAWPIPILP